MVKGCGLIEVTSNELTAEAQTYSVECGKVDAYPLGNKVSVRLEDTNEPLEIAEIIVIGWLGKFLNCGSTWEINSDLTLYTYLGNVNQHESNSCTY